MGILEIVFMGVALAMDASSVAVCKGLCMKKMEWKKAFKIGMYFGVFQGLMPIIGYFLGTNFAFFVVSFDHWIAFGLLSIIGGKMLFDLIRKREDSSKHDDNVCFKSMIGLAIATSIDALAVGITFAFLDVNIWISALIIAVVTFVLSVLGVKIGNIFGNRFERKAQFIGGIILILIGIKILLEHLEIFQL